MANYEFTATHGVHLYDLGVTFRHDSEATGNGPRVYRATTSDASVAKALRELNDYGIAEVKGSKPKSD